MKTSWILALGAATSVSAGPAGGTISEQVTISDFLLNTTGESSTTVNFSLSSGTEATNLACSTSFDEQASPIARCGSSKYRFGVSLPGAEGDAYRLRIFHDLENGTYLYGIDNIHVLCPEKKNACGVPGTFSIVIDDRGSHD